MDLLCDFIVDAPGGAVHALMYPDLEDLHPDQDLDFKSLPTGLRGEELVVSTLTSAVAVSSALIELQRQQRPPPGATRMPGTRAPDWASPPFSHRSAVQRLAVHRSAVHRSAVQRLATNVISAVTAAPLASQEAEGKEERRTAPAEKDEGDDPGQEGRSGWSAGEEEEEEEVQMAGQRVQRAVIRIRDLHPDSLAALAGAVATLRPRKASPRCEPYSCLYSSCLLVIS